ncbi:hypothetical protein ACHAWF_013107 [Thalassiosira exigua]
MRGFPRNVVRYAFAAAFAGTYLLRDLAHHAQPTGSFGDGPFGGVEGGIDGIGGQEFGSGHVRATTSASAWTESHSPYHVMDPSIRISFRLHDPADVPRPSKFLSVKPYTCGDDKADLPPSLSPRSVLGFTATIATDLKVVHLGDSLGQQFVQGFDASVLGSGYDGHRVALQEYTYEGGIYSHHCLSVAAPIRGGGISSYWRVTDLISKDNMRKEAACTKEELKDKQTAGWSMRQSLELVSFKYRYANNETEKVHHPVGPFDAVIMRIPHGWMDVPDITRERLEEAIHLAHENLGVQTVVVTTLPFNNNVLTASDWEGIHEINDMIRTLAREWTPASDGKGIKWMLVQEFGDFANQILWQSARHLGYDPSPSDATPRRDGWELSGTDFLLDRLPLAKRKWPPSIPMVCAERPAGKKDCVRNRISTDGMHWCVETLGPRYAASVACLLGCVYNGRTPGEKEDVRECERECNERFMSIDPVDETWIGGATVFARR